MGKIKDIKNSIVKALEVLQYGDETAYAQVVSDTRPTFEQYPAARVILNGQPNEVSTNQQNERTAEFLVISYIQYESNPGQPGVEADPDNDVEGQPAVSGEAAAFDVGYDLTDLAVDALDNLEPKDENGKGFTVMTEPTQSGWEILETDAGNVLSIMATVRIRYSHDIVNNIG